MAIHKYVPILVCVAFLASTSFTQAALINRGTDSLGNRLIYDDILNVTSSEMGHLFYASLGNSGSYDSDGNPFAGAGLGNVGEFLNLQEAMYYSSTLTSVAAWAFDFETGYQYPRDTTDGAFDLAVRDGDVVGVPEPPVFLLMAIGLTCLCLSVHHNSNSRWV
ncbi:MAG: hypothetical protein KZQ99_10680 [Candidatus Thiodiazotropha sp. (ex Dulcina madagascariensis)]|nr:hypothetical protein [Candidatus Thiodiazotropha sp. (ex Dulcina madagascariensis)]